MQFDSSIQGGVVKLIWLHMYLYLDGRCKGRYIKQKMLMRWETNVL